MTSRIIKNSILNIIAREGVNDVTSRRTHFENFDERYLENYAFLRREMYIAEISSLSSIKLAKVVFSVADDL